MLCPKEIYHPAPLSVSIDYARKAKSAEARRIATEAGLSQAEIDRAASYACDEGMSADAAVKRAKE